MGRDKLREAGLAGIFLLFVVLMHSDFTGFFTKPVTEKKAQVLAANTKKSPPKKATPTLTPTINPKYYVTWTPTPSPVNNQQIPTQNAEATTSSTDANTQNTPEPTSTPQPTATPAPQVQSSEPTREPDRFLNDVTDIVDPRDQLPL